MSFTEENLIFIIKNSNPNFNKTNETKGIGIENTKKRLDLIYGENYTLNVDENKEFYKINLNVPL
jgi:sensor histidine kinase YesM